MDQLLEKSKFHYKLNADDLWYKKGGVFSSKVETSLPYVEIQDVYLDRDLFDRIFGLGGLIVTKIVPGEVAGEAPKKPSFFSGLNSKYSPDKNKNELRFTGLKNADAETLQNILLKKMEDHKKTVVKSI